MTETTVGTDLLQALKVVTQLSLNVVRQNLRVLAGGEVLLSVKEPGGNLELLRRLEDVDNALKLIRVEFTGTGMVSMTVPKGGQKTGTSARDNLAPDFLAHAKYVPLSQVDIGLLADDVGVATTHTLDLSQGVLDLALAVHVSVQQTSSKSELFFHKKYIPQDVREVHRRVRRHERHGEVS